MSVYSANQNSFVTSYNGNSYVSQHDIVGAIASGDFGNGHTDLVVSIIHVVVYSTYSGTGNMNDPQYNTAMYFNRGIYVLWNTGGATNWLMTPLYGTRNYSPTLKQGTLTLANGDNNGAAMDIAVGDFNGDGCDDIAAVYQNGTTQIWLSRWSEVQGTSNPFDSTFNTTASLIPASSIPTVPGTRPFTDHTGKTVRISIGDMDGNGYPDIIRTSSAPMLSGGNTIYTIDTMPAMVTYNLKNPTSQFGGSNNITAKVTGSIANLAGVDNNWQNLTEVYQNSSVLYERPAQQTSDTTGQTLSNLQYDDGLVYNVAKSTQLEVIMAGAPPSYNGMPVTQVTLRVKYSDSADYDGSNSLMWSTDGINWHSTSIKPTANQQNVNLTVDLKAAGVTTWTQLQTIYVKFANNEVNGANAVRFDYVWLEVKFAVSRDLEWTWEVPNVSGLILHNLTINAKLLTSGETFNVSYSTDNVTFFPLFQISSTTEQSYSTSLMDTTNSLYYIRIEDTDHASSDSVNSTLCVNMVVIKHYVPSVSWVIGPSRAITTLSDPMYITAIAVADIGSSSGDHAPDGHLDVVVGTSEIGKGDYTHTLFVITGQGISGFDTPINIPVVAAAAAVGSNNYQVTAIQIGDFNGDGYPDIAMAIGFTPGYSYTAGSTSTLWVYTNQPSLTGWQFSEQAVNVLDTSGSTINIITGNVDLTLLWPLFGVFGIVVAEAVIERVDRKRKA